MELGPVIITAREVYDAVIRVSAQVQELNGRLDQVRTFQAESTKIHDDQEVRIRSLEKGRWPLQSLSMLCALAALCVAILTR